MESRGRGAPVCLDDGAYGWGGAGPKPHEVAFAPQREHQR